MALQHDRAPEHYEALLFAGADITLQVRGPQTVIQRIASDDVSVSSLA